jgi:5-methylcytosine-specific restriction endonuclease McrA
VCDAVSQGEAEAATGILEASYPYAPGAVTKRRVRPVDWIRVFVRDGFIDRYDGARLVFPPVLRMVSHALPARFPYHPHWRTPSTHPAYWEVSATIDHVIPVTRGGTDEASNWVTTSMAHNSAKMNWTLGELGWQLQKRGDVREWDGLLAWCVEYSAQHPDAIVDRALRRWLHAGSLVWAKTQSTGGVQPSYAV